MPQGLRPWVRSLAVLAAFAAIAALYVRPLFSHLDTRLALDSGDPALNAAVLTWNAKVAPFTAAWWNEPWFYPATGVTAFTENLVGLAPIATPVYWITGKSVATYNITFFATWPLCAFAAFFMVRRITGRADAGVLAGLAFAFTPYRGAVELGHIQSLAAMWLPFAIGAMHAYLDDGRARWLVLFAVAWILQALSNGYYLLFGSILIPLWLTYFGSVARSWRAALRLGGVWVLATLALAPVLLNYKHIHESYGMKRTMAEAIAFSAHADSFLQVSPLVRLWHQVLPPGKEMLFPGLTPISLVALALVIGVWRRRTSAPSPRWTFLGPLLAIAALASAVALAIWFLVGSWSLSAGSVVLFRMGNPNRAWFVLALSVVGLVWFTRVRSAIASRHPIVFYALATILMGLLACGPVLSVRDTVLLDPSPYRLLMMLPGFDELRVPSRFWMMGVLCLSSAAGIAFAAITRAGRTTTAFAGVVAALAILADGWLTTMPMKGSPAFDAVTATGASAPPLLELPLGPAWDAAATLRSAASGRRVLNGVSGYEPPYYTALKTGLSQADPEMLAAIATLGTYDIRIHAWSDPDGGWRRYVMTAPGAEVFATDREITVVRVPTLRRDEPALGPPLQVVAITASGGGDPAAAIDGRTETIWAVPQRAQEWLIADLGRVQQVAGISIAAADHPAGFPRLLAIDTSLDGQQFHEAWQGGGAPPAFLAIVKSPRNAWLRLPIPPQDARFVRIRQLREDAIGWFVPELEINSSQIAKR